VNSAPVSAVGFRTVRASDSLALAAAAPNDPAVRADLASVPAADRRDRFTCLLGIYDLYTAPLPEVGDAARLIGTPELALLKGRLEAEWLAELETLPLPRELSGDPVEAMRVLAARNRLPTVYRWLAGEAGREQLIHFLAVEGGPDSGFDDLVATCQVGLFGSAKMEMAQNYWDEMGNGSLDDVHTTLHQRMAQALGMPRIPRSELPVEALERSALGGLLATNRWLQPEMVGALGMIELQAGPRCRLVLKGFSRVGVPPEAYPFYEVHAEVDPRHGQDWLDKVVAPLAAEQPAWQQRIVRGAWWRAVTNAGLFDLLGDQLAVPAAA
jgi:Iron-containing redox enzyme